MGHRYLLATLGNADCSVVSLRAPHLAGRSNLVVDAIGLLRSARNDCDSRVVIVHFCILCAITDVVCGSFQRNTSGVCVCSAGEGCVSKMEDFVMGSRKSKKEIAAIESASGMMSQVWSSLLDSVKKYGGDTGCLHRLVTPAGIDTIDEMARVAVRGSVGAGPRVDDVPVAQDVMERVEEAITDLSGCSFATKRVLVWMLHQTCHGARGVIVDLHSSSPASTDVAREVFYECDNLDDIPRWHGFPLTFGGRMNPDKVWMMPRCRGDEKDAEVLTLDLDELLESERSV